MSEIARRDGWYQASDGNWYHGQDVRPYASPPKRRDDGGWTAPLPAPHRRAPRPVAYAPATVVHVHQQQRGLFVRALWYVFVGWWLSGIVMAVASFCFATVVLVPAGLGIVNRLPGVLTLRPRSTAMRVSTGRDGVTHVTVGRARQRNILVRTAYFLVFGLWVGVLAMWTAWFLALTIVGLPLSLMVLNRLPAVLTLRRN